MTYTPELDRIVCAYAMKHYRPNGHLAPEDVRQIGRIAAWQALPKYRGLGGQKLTTFVYENIRWRIIDAYRRRPPVPVAELEDGLVPDVAERVVGDARVADLLSGLTVRQRELVQRVDIDGERPVDVARDLGLHKGTVAYVRHRALRRLREAA